MLQQLDTLIGFAVVMSVVSLLITIITQMISSLLGLRGKNLADALVVMIHQIDPTIAQTSAKELAKKILTHPVISDSTMSMDVTFWDKIPALRWLRQGWKTATAIRADELLGILRTIAGDSAPAPWSPQAPAPVAAAEAAEQAPGMEQIAAAILIVLNRPSDSASTAIRALHSNLPALVALEGTAVVQHLESVANVSLSNLDKWFNSAQDRAQEWFAMHTHWITVGASFAAAFVLQLDAIDLLKRVSTDSDLRAKLVARADAVQKQAENALSSAHKDVIDSGTHQQVVAELRKTYAQIPANLDTHADFASLAEAQKWLGEQLQADPQKDEIVDAYGHGVVIAKLGSSVQTMQNVAADYQKTGLQLLPEPYPLNRTWPEPHWFYLFDRTWSWPLHRMLGILISAALLSLGAPFWFNTLKSLTNLRPILASEVDKNPKQTTAPGSSGK